MYLDTDSYTVARIKMCVSRKVKTLFHKKRNVKTNINLGLRE
jgi:hypothetical protein